MASPHFVQGCAGRMGYRSIVNRCHSHRTLRDMAHNIWELSAGPHQCPANFFNLRVSKLRDIGSGVSRHRCHVSVVSNRRRQSLHPGDSTKTIPLDCGEKSVGNLVRPLYSAETRLAPVKSASLKSAPCSCAPPPTLLGPKSAFFRFAP